MSDDAMFERFNDIGSFFIVPDTNLLLLDWSPVI